MKTMDENCKTRNFPKQQFQINLGNSNANKVEWLKIRVFSSVLYESIVFNF